MVLQSEKCMLLMENELMAMIFERFWHGRGVSFGMADGIDSGKIAIRERVNFPRWDEVLDASDLGFPTTKGAKPTKGDWDPRWMGHQWLSCRLAFFGQDLQD